ncbi:hypothetical protein C2G38_2220081 [Gigaspora rosea]|uniref:Uncharacterized protein n=1 Tax=Gigaspora rosea TaxID=44941 RepID=A0A397U930_9GLOM|nr:hypothetical protein C2G38_2220081 [Gigaspora rosea]
MNGIDARKDKNKAFEWFLKSAEGDNSSGQCNLGSWYKQSIEIPKNENKAFERYWRSSENGSSGAQILALFTQKNGCKRQKVMMFKELLILIMKIKELSHGNDTLIPQIPISVLMFSQRIGKDGFATVHLARLEQMFVAYSNIGFKSPTSLQYH